MRTVKEEFEITTQNKELENVKRKIKALCARTVENGCTEAEALTAADKISELLSTFNLSMSEIELREQKCETVTFTTSKTKEGIYYSWSGIAKLCGVRSWRSVGRKSYTWNFFGLEQDVALAKYLCELVDQSLKTSVAAFRETEVWTSYNGHRRTLTANFYRGFGQRINSRLKDLAVENAKKEREANAYHAANSIKVTASDEAIVAAANATTGTALISIAKAKIVDEEFNKLGMRLRNSYSSNTARYNSSANTAGSSAASKVNLSRPISGQSKTMAYLS